MSAPGLRIPHPCPPPRPCLMPVAGMGQKWEGENFHKVSSWQKDHCPNARSLLSPQGGAWGCQRAHCVPSMDCSMALQLRAEQIISQTDHPGPGASLPIKGGITKRPSGSRALQVRSTRAASLSPSPSSLLD